MIKALISRRSGGLATADIMADLLFPDAEQNRSVEGCAGAAIDILKVVAGIVIYAVDTLLMDRPRAWNYKQVHLDGSQDGHYTVKERGQCFLCNSRRRQLVHLLALGVSLEESKELFQQA